MSSNSEKSENSILPSGGRNINEKSVLGSSLTKECSPRTKNPKYLTSIGVVLNSIIIKLMTTAERYLDADSGDLKVLFA